MLDESQKWKKRYEREKNARLQAEKLLEEKSSQLYHANLQLEEKIALESSKYRLQEKKFTALFHSSIDGIILHQMDGQILDANEAVCAMTGRTPSALIGAHLKLIHPEEYQPVCQEALQEMEREGQVRFSCLIQNREGETTPVEISAKQFEVEGEIVCQGIIRDVTAQHQAAKKLQDATIAAIKANEAKSLFLATMSHEIRTPLNGIIGFTDLLLQSELSLEQFQHLELVKKSGDMLLNIINDILDFSRIESNQIELEEVDFSLTECLEETFDIHSQTALAKNVDLLYSIDEDVPNYLNGDPGRIKQVLLNLVSNGLKFTEKGSVIIRVQKLTSDVLQLTVSDTGLGFDQELEAQLFQPFQQADPSTTRKFGGTGLGLAICRQLLGIMGGSISAKSVVGRGSDFIVTFPFKLAQAPPAQANLNKKPFSEYRVLVVDDYEVNLQFMKFRLEAWGCQVSLATGSHEALTMMKQTETAFDVILIDRLMPQMDGIQLALEIRKSFKGNIAEMILVTSSRLEGEKQEAIDAGISSVVYKPVKEKDLLASLNLIFNNKKPTSITPTPSLPAKSKKPSTNRFVLIVEDNPINAKLAKLLLERQGLNAHIAYNGQEALASLKEHKIYELILMDMQMPVMDGLEATQKIRHGAAGECYQNIPIVAMTANVSKEDEVKCAEYGMNAYLTKPIDVSALCDLLEELAVL